MCPDRLAFCRLYKPTLLINIWYIVYTVVYYINYSIYYTIYHILLIVLVYIIACTVTLAAIGTKTYFIYNIPVNAKEKS